MKVSAIIVTRGDVDLELVMESLPVGWEVIIWDNGAGVVTLHQVDFGHLPMPPEGETITVTKMTDPGHLGRFAAVVPLGGQPDLSVYGRYVAIQYATGDLIYVQDDDVIVSDPQAIVDAWVGRWQDMQPDDEGSLHDHSMGPEEAPFLVANMPPEFRHDGYTDSALVGFGAAFYRDLPARAFAWFRDWQLRTSGIAIRESGNDWFQRTADVVFTTLTPRVLVNVPKTNLPWAEDEGRMYRQLGHVEERQRMLELARKVRDGR